MTENPYAETKLVKLVSKSRESVDYEAIMTTLQLLQDSLTMNSANRHN
jgi:hypothetical protein